MAQRSFQHARCMAICFFSEEMLLYAFLIGVTARSVPCVDRFVLRSSSGDRR